MKKKKIVISLPKPSTHKSFTLYNYDTTIINTCKELGRINKNVYNIAIFSIQVFNTFKTQLYQTLYNDLKKHRIDEIDNIY